MPYPKLWASARLLLLSRKQDHGPRTKEGRAVGRWMSLFSQALTSPTLGRRTSQSAFQRFGALLKLAREDESANRLIIRSGAAHRHQAHDAQTENHGPHKKDSSNPLHRISVGSAYEKFSFNSVRALGGKCGHGESSTSQRKTSAAECRDSEFMQSLSQNTVAESKHSFTVLEGVYALILGDQWHYRTCSHGPEMDLFLWAILMRRQKMAKLIWGRLELPIFAALTAVVFYRNWAKYSEVKPHQDSHTHTNTLTHTLSLSHTHTQTHTLTHKHTNTHTHTHTHTHKHTHS
jgi:hypothetical protein